MNPSVAILLPGTDITELQTHHREAFLFRLRNAYPDQADTVRRQAERLAAEWWPDATQHEDVA